MIRDLSRHVITHAIVVLALLPALAGAAGARALGAELAGAVVVGGVTEQSARFWVRLSGAGAARIEASASPLFGITTRSEEVTVTAPRNFAAVLALSGLQADTRYYYRVVIDGTPSGPVRSFQTFPVPGQPSVFTFGFGSCQQSGGQLPSATSPGRIFSQVVKAEPRIFLQIGDWGYPDSTDRLPQNTDYFSTSFARVQASYLTKFDPAYPMDSLMSRTPVDYVYDDHDFLNDNSSALSTAFSVPYRPNAFGQDFVVEDLPAPSSARENSIRGYLENMPTYALPNSSRGIYHSFRCGSAEFFMLDLRSQRSPNLEIFAKNASTQKWEVHWPPGHSILGREGAPGSGESQLSWLLRGLRTSSATWKFLASSVPFNRSQAIGLAFGILLQDSVVSLPSLPAGTTPFAAALELSDKWPGFPEDQDTLLHTIARLGLKNVIVLSGDAHTAAIDDGTFAGLPEIMAGGLDITNSGTAGFFAAAGFNIWNKGAQGVTTPVLNNAFGRVTVFGDDSVQLALVDEEGVVFARHTVRNGTTVIPEARGAVAAGYRLAQNYPNPFNPATVIEYMLPAEGDIRLAVYDVLGREVALLVDGRQEAGMHAVRFDAGRLAGGIYLYRLTSGAFRGARRMLLLR